MSYDRAAALPVYRLAFEEYPGLVVRARRPGFRGEGVVAAAWPVLRAAQTGPRVRRRAMTAVAEAMVDTVVDWTLEWDGAPLAVSLDAVLRLDTLFLAELVAGWVEQVVLAGSTPATAPPPSADTGRSRMDPVLAEVTMLDRPADDAAVPAPAAEGVA